MSRSDGFPTGRTLTARPPQHDGGRAPLRMIPSKFPTVWRCPECHADTGNPDSCTNCNAGTEEPTTAAPLALGPKGGVLVTKLAERIRDELGLIPGEDGRLWRYASGVYRPDGDIAAKALARELLGDKFKRSHLEEVNAWLRADARTITGEPTPQYLNLRNGLLDWRAEWLGPHKRAVRSTWQLPVCWNPDAPEPTAALEFLERVLPPDSGEFVFELLGYLLYPGNPFRKAVLLLGSGRNGKSTFLELCRRLIGPENCASVPLQTLTENRFAPSTLYGKPANIAGDLDARAIRRSDAFKVLTGGDQIHTERKYGDAFSFRWWGVPLFSANEAPLSSDQTDGWFDRWIIVPFPARLTESEVDPDLLGKLTTRSELEGLLWLAVRGLQRLMDRGRFEMPPSIAAACDAYRERLDTVRAFVAERCAFNPQGWIERPLLYRTYREWVTEGGRLPLGSVTFREHLERYAAELGRPLTVSTRRGRRGLAGIEWAS